MSSADTIIVATLGVQESREGRMVNIRINGVTSPEVASMFKQAHLGEPSSRGNIDWHPGPSLLRLGIGCIFHNQNDCTL